MLTIAHLHKNPFAIFKCKRVGVEEGINDAFDSPVGVVSNHGNWFIAEDHNKELKVLAQSYDWLLFFRTRDLLDSSVNFFHFKK